jgi:hypothetical protein
MPKPLAEDDLTLDMGKSFVGKDEGNVLVKGGDDVDFGGV